MKKLKKIIDNIIKLRDKKFNPSDDAVLISATQILLGKKDEVNKSKRPYNKSIFDIKDPEAPATENQIFRLDKMEVEYPKEITKGEAHILISETIKLRSEDRNAN